MENKVLVSITTTWGSDWKKQISDATRLGLEELAVFPTCLDLEQRKEFYRLLENSSVKSIPYCHLRGDMTLAELDYFVQKYQTRAFSAHMQVERPSPEDWTKYRQSIYIEFVYHALDQEELGRFGGICLDLSHLENDRISRLDNYEKNVKIIEKNYIGVNHIGAIRTVPRLDDAKATRYDWHVFQGLSEFDYLKRYPLNYFSPFIALEVENSIQDQLKAKDYINGTIFNR